VLALGALRRRTLLPTSLVVWPAIVGLGCFAQSELIGRAFFTGVIGVVHPITVAICLLTIVIPAASIATLISTVRWCFRPERPSVLALMMPMTYGLVFTAFSLWLAAHGWFAFRTWAF